MGGDEPKVQEWTDEYIKQAAQQFESNMAKIIGAATKQDSGAVSTSTIESNLQKMAGLFIILHFLQPFLTISLQRPQLRLLKIQKLYNQVNKVMILVQQ